jgi:hypothetical protein
MNVKEFAALKQGDKVALAMNGQSGQGEVVSVDPMGVRVRWGDNRPNAPTFFYSVNGTSWFHWSKVEAKKKCPTGPDCSNPERCTATDQCLGGDYDVMSGVKPYPPEATS